MTLKRLKMSELSARRVKPVPAPDPMLDAFLATLTDPAAAATTRAVLADWFEEQGRPSAVRLHHLPNWLRLAWLHVRQQVGELQTLLARLAACLDVAQRRLRELTDQIAQANGQGGGNKEE
jgi:uncharacterized protein (TIGR02996 family)